MQWENSYFPRPKLTQNVYLDIRAHKHPSPFWEARHRAPRDPSSSQASSLDSSLRYIAQTSVTRAYSVRCARNSRIFATCAVLPSRIRSRSPSCLLLPTSRPGNLLVRLGFGETLCSVPSTRLLSCTTLIHGFGQHAGTSRPLPIANEPGSPTTKRLIKMKAWFI